jgi:hypothetical protein
VVLDRKQWWRSWRSQDLRLRLVGPMHGRETGRRRVRPEFAIWPSGAWPLLPPAPHAQAQELAGSAFIEQSRRKPSSALEVVRASKSYVRRVQFVNLTLDKNEAANAVAGGLKRRRAQLFGWALCFLWVLRKY